MQSRKYDVLERIDLGDWHIISALLSVSGEDEELFNSRLGGCSFEATEAFRGGAEKSKCVANLYRLSVGDLLRDYIIRKVKPAFT